MPFGVEGVIVTKWRVLLELGEWVWFIFTYEICFFRKIN